MCFLNGGGGFVFAVSVEIPECWVSGRFSFPSVCPVSPQAWRGWRTSGTPATWTPPYRPCPTGEMFTYPLTVLPVCLISLLGHLKGGILFLKSSAVLIDWKDFLLGLCEMSVLQSWPLCCCVRCVTSQPQQASSQKPFAVFYFFSFAFQPSAWVSSVNKRWSLFIGPEWRLSVNCCSAPFEEAEATFLLLPIGSYVTNEHQLFPPLLFLLPASFLFRPFSFSCLSLRSES